MRVGAVFPGKLAATWPLLGLRFDEASFELRAVKPLRLVMTRLLGPRWTASARGGQVVACAWDDVVSLRRVSLGVELSLLRGDRVRIYPVAPQRIAHFVDRARARGVAVMDGD